MRRRIETDAVRAVLTGERVLEHFGVDGRGTHTITLRECPRCRQTPRRVAVRVDRDTGRWVHHGGGKACRGDAFDLVAACMGLDARRDVDFPRVLEVAARIAGVGPDIDHAELARLRDEHRARQAERDRREAAERAEGEALVPGLWEALDRRHLRGERYLRKERGLDPVELRRAGDLVRFDVNGSPSVRLHNLKTGAPINIIQRRIDREPKILALDLRRTLGRGDVIGGYSTCGSLIGRISDIDAEGQDVAILTEGVADTLAATLAFPTCAVVGANGCHMMKYVAAAIAPRLVAARGWLLIVPHVDGGKGEECAADAVRVASRAGLRLDKSIHLVDVRPSKDLADAWRAGWRWSWL